MLLLVQRHKSHLLLLFISFHAKKKTANLLTDGFLKGFNNLDNSLFIFYNQIANGKNLAQKCQIWSC